MRHLFSYTCAHILICHLSYTHVSHLYVTCFLTHTSVMYTSLVHPRRVGPIRAAESLTLPWQRQLVAYDATGPLRCLTLQLKQWGQDDTLPVPPKWQEWLVVTRAAGLEQGRVKGSAPRWLGDTRAPMVSPLSTPLPHATFFQGHLL